MKRVLLLLALLLLPLAACNPDDPTGPENFFWADVFGLWKMRMESEGCAPGAVLNLQIGQFGSGVLGDSIIVGGSWFLDEKNPSSRSLRGYFSRSTGAANLRLDQDGLQTIDGYFISSRDFGGAYVETDGCSVRVRGTFIE